MQASTLLRQPGRAWESPRLATHSSSTRHQKPFAATIAISDCRAGPGRPALLPLPPPVQHRCCRRQQQQARRQQWLQPQAALPEALAALEVSPARDAAAAAFAVFGSVCLIKIFDSLERHGVIDQVASQPGVARYAVPWLLLPEQTAAENRPMRIDECAALGGSYVPAL